MNGPDKPLVKHLTLAVILKLLVLGLLWWFFVRKLVAHPDASAVAEHIANTPAAATVTAAASATLSVTPSSLQGARP